MKRILVSIVVASSVLVLAPIAAAQSDRAQSDKWAPWLGCWNLIAESVREGGPAADPGERSTPPARQAPQVCVSSTGANAVTMTTTVEGQPALEQTIVADGSEQPISDASCRGTQRAEWSRSGTRLFAIAQLTCTEQLPRRVSGLSFIAPDGTWFDIRAVRMGTNETTRLARYRRADGQPSAGAPSRFTLEEITEASLKLSSRVVEAALVETKTGFDLTSQMLIDLDGAGVPDSVTDLLIALSYPERFVVERTARNEPSFGPIDFGPDTLPWSFGYPLFGGFYDDWYFPAYYYSPFAYLYAGRFDPRFGWGYYSIAPGGDGGGGSGGDIRPSGQGRVVDGAGYTRVRERNSEPRTASNGSSGDAAQSSGGSSSSSGSSGGSSVSGQGFSSGGGGGGDGGRTAVPR